MNIYKKFFLSIILILFFSSYGYSQFRYFAKIFEENDKKYIQIFEENNNKQHLISQVEDEKAYNDYKKKFKEDEKKRYSIGGNFKSREEFFFCENKSDFLRNLQEESRRKTLEALSQIKPGGYQAAKIKSSAFKDIPDLNLSLKSYKERNSLVNVTNAKVYISIPETNTEFKNIFNNENFRNNQYENTKKIKQTIKKEANPNVHFTETAEFFTKTISSTPENKPIILIGHNENGEFRFPDGSRTKFDQIDSFAGVAKRCIIYLSCNANQFTKNPAPNYFLTYNDGIAIANRINNSLKKIASLGNSNIQLKDEINKIIVSFGKEKRQQRKYKLVVSSITITGVVYTFYEIKEGDK